MLLQYMPRRHLGSRSHMRAREVTHSALPRTALPRSIQKTMSTGPESWTSGKAGQLSPWEKAKVYGMHIIAKQKGVEAFRRRHPQGGEEDWQRW